MAISKLNGVDVTDASTIQGVSGFSKIQGVDLAASYDYLLDDYPTAAAAYSIRLLRLGYTGPLVEIRRSSDNAVKDFYPDSNNVLSLTSEDGSSTSLSSWLSTDNGFIRTWYDQSGNAVDMTQTTTANQPQIASSGSLITVNSVVALDFTDGASILSDKKLSGGQISSFASGAFMFQVRAFNVAAAASFAKSMNFTDGTRMLGNGFQSNNASYNNAHIISDAFSYRLGTGYTLDTNQTIDITMYDGNGTGSGNQANFDFYKDNTQHSPSNSQSFGAADNTNSYINDWKNLNQGCNQYIQEVVFWSSDLTADRTGITTNVNNYYSIF